MSRCAGMVWSGLLFASGSAVCAQVGPPPGIQSMGMLPGHVWSDAWAISRDGLALAGYSAIGAEDQATRWTEPSGGGGGLESLGTLPIFGRTWAWGASNGGDVVVGYGESLPSGWYRGFRWTAATGMEDLGLPSGFAEVWVGGVSADGNVIVGDVSSSSGLTVRAFRWTTGTGFELLPQAPGYSQASAGMVNSDGSVIVGSHRSSSGPSRLMRWTAAGGTEDLGALPGTGLATSVSPRSMSEDGWVIVGDASLGSPGPRVFRWTRETGFVILDPLPPIGTQWVYAYAGGTSADGSVVTGRSTYRAFMWTEALGTVDLNVYAPSVGIDLTGWHLSEIMDVSADGRAMAGNGTFGSDAVGFRLVLPPVGGSSPCYANCDGSTAEPVLNVDDFTCFINAFASAMNLPHEEQVEHYANCDGSTNAPALNVDDFTCFINAFAAGCR